MNASKLCVDVAGAVVLGAVVFGAAFFGTDPIFMKSAEAYALFLL